MKVKYTLVMLLSMLVMAVSAQTPLWQGKGRIAISSDGNEHDHDDWAATPLSLAVIAAKGLQDKLAVYTYSDHIWGSNQLKPSSHGMSAYEHMRESALGGAREFGFDAKRFVCAVDNAEVAYRAMMEQINLSSQQNPLIIIAAGPMQVVGEAINRSEIECRKYVTVVSHSKWNNNHSDNLNTKRYWDKHSGWTFSMMEEAFGTNEGGAVNFVRILDQNGGEDYEGLYAPIERFDWVKSSADRNNPAYKEGSWDWLYGRLSTCIKKKNSFDASDSGMVVFVLTGIEKTSTDIVREIMENPVAPL